MTNERRPSQSVIVSHGSLRLRVTVSAGAVTDVDLPALDQPLEALPAQADGPDADLLRRAHDQLHEYLAGKRRDFDLPLRQPGTLFQDSVWQALRQIPFGHTLTYAGLAAKLNKPGAARAVGGALNKNRLPILIPCHRILAADGMGGFSCGPQWKQALLGIEGVGLGLS